MTAYFRDAIREQREHSARRPDPFAADGGNRRRPAHRRRSDRQLHRDHGRRTGNHHQPDWERTAHPAAQSREMERLRNDPSLIPSAVEEMLRYESPSQHTARMCPSDRELGGKLIQKRQAVIAVMAAANRDPERFPDPDRFDIARKDNRHLAFGYAAHFCFGAPLARVEGQVVFEALLRRLGDLTLTPEPIEWRSNLGLRGLKALRVKFGGQTAAKSPAKSTERQPERVNPAVTPAVQARCPYEARESSQKKATQDGTPEGKQDLIRKYLQSRVSHKVDDAPTIPRSQPGPAPLSFAQEQIWLHWPVRGRSLQRIDHDLSPRGARPADARAQSGRDHSAARGLAHDLQSRSMDNPCKIVQPPFEPGR